MSRIHGQRGRMYIGLASSTANAEPITYLSSWTLESMTDTVEVTAFEDNNKTYVAGKPDSSGTFRGFYDTATAQTYTPSRDGLPRKFYLYPDSNSATRYFYGDGIFDYSIEGSVDGAVTLSGNWKASSDITFKQ